ncbi:MAG: hypothetical protein KBC11_01925 [Candidatus Pacebacteria bacterium]|nr:hypothetical protein [Candidatus Paceibacterota bacterium]
MFKKYITLLFASILVVSSFYIGFNYLNQKNVSAAGEVPVTGWLWSDTVGWVSLNCSNNSTCGTVSYSVMQSTDGSWTGYGWNDNIGWLDFNTGCPAGTAGTCGAQMISNSLKGWARFTSASEGWDGWVSFSSTNDHDRNTAGVQQAPYSYGATRSGDNVFGYAWGSEIVGWLSFENVVVPNNTGPTGTLLANSCNIASGAANCNSTVDWTTADLTASSTSITRNTGAPSSFTPSPLASGSQSTVLSYGATTFYLYHNSIELAQSTANATCDSGLAWNGSTCETSTKGPTVTLNASPMSIFSGGSATLSWISSNVTSCTASGGSWTGPKPVTSSYPHDSTGTLTSTTTFTLSCTGPFGNAVDQKTVTVLTAGPGITVDLIATPEKIASGESSTLSWISSGATSCSGIGFTAGALNGSIDVSPTRNTTYTINCVNGSLSASDQASVTLRKKFLFIEF